MSHRHRHPAVAPAALIAGIAALALAGAPAASAAGNAIVQDCINNGYVNPDRYSRGELQRARDGLPSDIAEYTDCYDVISEALNGKRKRDGGNSGGGAAGGGGGGGGGASGGGGPPTADELGKARNEIESTLQRPAPEVVLGGSAGVPKLGGIKPAATDNDLPLPVLVALLAVALTLATGAILTLGGRLRDPLRRLRK